MEWFELLFRSSAFDPTSMWSQVELILRLALACACGALIGLERSRRLKDAGIRTHVVVALGAAMMMIVSKYAFYDVVAATNEGIKLQADVSRVASQIVTGVGFLGAGVIFTKRSAVHGLTTAAGVWATAGVGMAIGGGMYLLGVCGALAIVLCQFLLHRILRKAETVELIVTLVDKPDVLEHIKAGIGLDRLQLVRMNMETRAKGEMTLSLLLKIPENFNFAEMTIALTQDPNVIAFSTHSQTQEDM